MLQHRTQQQQRIITVFCLFHLADHIYNMNLFCQIATLLREHNIKIHYYCPNQYHKQLRDFAPPTENILEIRAMRDLDGDAIFDKGLAPGWFSPLLEMNITNRKLPVNLYNRTHTNFDQLYEEFYEQFIRTYLPNAHPSCWMPTFICPARVDLIECYENLHENFKDLDILFINPARTWDKFIIHTIKLGCKVAITTPIVRRTRARAYSHVIETKIKTIAAISTHAKFVIATTAAAETAACFNTYTMNYVNKMYIFDRQRRNITFKHEKIAVFEEISNLFKELH